MKQIAPKEVWTGTGDCRTCSMGEDALFADLKGDDFNCFHSPVDQFNYGEGTTIYRAGASHGSLFAIRSGLVKLVHYLPDGSQRIVRLLRKGDVGGLECFAGDNYHHDAIALHPTAVCRINIDDVKRLAGCNPGLFDRLMTRWNRALTDADYWLTGFSTGTARERMALLLLHLAVENEDRTCKLFGREDIGGVLGITTETASRIIAEFKRKKVITELRSNVFQCDLDMLREISGGKAED